MPVLLSSLWFCVRCHSHFCNPQVGAYRVKSWSYPMLALGSPRKFQYIGGKSLVRLWMVSRWMAVVVFFMFSMRVRALTSWLCLLAVWHSFGILMDGSSLEHCLRGSVDSLCGKTQLALHRRISLDVAVGFCLFGVCVGLVHPGVALSLEKNPVFNRKALSEKHLPKNK